MKHQLFKKSTYVQIDVGKSHLTIVGKVKNAEIKINRITSHGIFNIPQQSIEIESKLLIVQENPEIIPVLMDDISFIEDIIVDFDAIVAVKGVLFTAIEDLDIPGDELKKLYYNLNQGAKSNYR